MKKNYFFYVLALLLLVNYSCKEDQLDFHSGAESIYFPNNETVGRVTGRQFDFYSFGYVSAYVDHYIHKIPVRATGRMQDYDREFQVKVTDTSTMVLGEDYEFVNERFVMRANRLTDTIYLKIKRSSNLKKTIVSVGLQLEANTNFTTELDYQIIGTGENQKKVSLTGYNFGANDMAGAPWFWDPLQTKQANGTISYLGPYSSKKFQLLIARFGLDSEPMLVEKYFPTLPMFNTWGYGMKAYFTEMEKLGTPVLEENGQPMKMGISIR